MILGNRLDRLARKFGLENGNDDRHLKFLISTLTEGFENFSSLIPERGQIIGPVLRDKKSSDTIFILGSGPSINTLSSEQLREISSSDSVGFNYWPFHELVPTFYFFQQDREGPARLALNRLIKLRENDYRNSEILIRGDHTFRGKPSFTELVGDFFPDKKLWFVPELAIHSKVQIDPIEMMKFFEALGFLNFGQVPKAIPKWRGTLGLMLSFAFQMGYRKVVLCGVDMNDATHFYSTQAYQQAFPEIRQPVGTGVSHFESRSYSRNTVSRYVVSFAQFARERADARVFLASSESKLSGLIPGWDFRT